MIAFESQGPILAFTSASSAPTSVQALPSSNLQSGQVMLTNVSSTIDAVIGWGETDTKAKENSVLGASQNQYYLLRGTQVVISAKGPYFTGIAVSSTADIKVQSGTGN